MAFWWQRGVGREASRSAWACKAGLLALFFPRVAGRARCTSCRPGPVEQTAGGLPGWDSVLVLSPGWLPRKKIDGLISRSHDSLAREREEGRYMKVLPHVLVFMITVLLNNESRVATNGEDAAIYRQGPNKAGPSILGMRARA